MTDLDKQIAAALEGTTGSLAITDETSILEDITGTFAGHYRNLLILGWLKAIAFSVVLVYSIYQFFHQDSTMGMIAYATLAIISAITMATIYIMFNQFLNRNIMTREIKRLELQIALLVRSLEQRTTN